MRPTLRPSTARGARASAAAQGAAETLARSQAEQHKRSIVWNSTSLEQVREYEKNPADWDSSDDEGMPVMPFSPDSQRMADQRYRSTELAFESFSMEDG